MRWAFVIFVSFGIAACGARLPRKTTDNVPKASGEEYIDLSQVRFLQLASGAETSVLELMEREDKEFLLLTFGSLGCGICNKKAGIIHRDIIGKHSLYFTEPGKKFAVLGVNTDSKPVRQLSLQLAETPFISLNDPGGKGMMAHFMPAGKTFAVPLTVLLNRRGLMWRLLPNESITVGELMQKVAASIGAGETGGDSGGSEGEGTGGGDTGGGNTGGGDGGGPPTALELPFEGRLRGVNVQDCAGTQRSVDSFFGKDSPRIVHVAKTCDAACAANQQTIAELNAQASAVTLLAEGACAGDRTAIGGAEFWTDSFAALFDHVYTPIEDGVRLSLPAVQGPLTLVFSPKGTLRGAWEGVVAKDLLSAALNPESTAINQGANFPMFDGGDVNFSSVRQRAEYTVLMTWGTECSTCVAELQHWSAPDNAYDFCAQSEGFCQIAALESHAVAEPFTSIAEYHQAIRTGFDDGITAFDGLEKLGVRIPHYVDPKPSENYLERIFDGYMLARRPDMGFLYRAFIYDREGKIVRAFASNPELEITGQDTKDGGGSGPDLLTILKELRQAFQDAASSTRQ